MTLLLFLIASVLAIVSIIATSPSGTTSHIADTLSVANYALGSFVVAALYLIAVRFKRRGIVLALLPVVLAFLPQPAALGLVFVLLVVLFLPRGPEVDEWKSGLGTFAVWLTTLAAILVVGLMGWIGTSLQSVSGSSVGRTIGDVGDAARLLPIALLALLAGGLLAIPAWWTAHKRESGRAALYASHLGLALFVLVFGFQFRSAVQSHFGGLISRSTVSPGADSDRRLGEIEEIEKKLRSFQHSGIVEQVRGADGRISSAKVAALPGETREEVEEVQDLFRELMGLTDSGSRDVGKRARDAIDNYRTLMTDATFERWEG